MIVDYDRYVIRLLKDYIKKSTNLYKLVLFYKNKKILIYLFKGSEKLFIIINLKSYFLYFPHIHLSVFFCKHIHKKDDEPEHNIHLHALCNDT